MASSAHLAGASRGLLRESSAPGARVGAFRNSDVMGARVTRANTRSRAAARACPRVSAVLAEPIQKQAPVSSFLMLLPFRILTSCPVSKAGCARPIGAWSCLIHSDAGTFIRAT